MNEKDLAEQLAQYGITAAELPVLLEREQTRKRNAEINATFGAIKVAAYGGQQEPGLDELLDRIDDVDRLRELVAMFAMALAGRRDVLHDDGDEYERSLLHGPVIANIEENAA